MTHQASVARKWLWIGLVAPFFYSASENASQAVSGVSTIEILRGGIPFVCLFVASVVCRPRRIRFGLAEWSLVGFVAVALLSTTWSISAHATLLKAISLASGFACLVLLVRLYEDYSQAIAGLMSWVHLILITTAVEAIVLRQQAFGSAPNVPRLGTVFPQIDTDILATVCLVGLIAVATNTGPVRLGRRWIRVSLAVIYAAELYETRTRTAILLAGVLLCLGAFAWARRSQVAVPRIAFCASALIILLVAGNAEISSYLYRQQSASVFSTLTGRTTQWSEADTLWKTKPIVGLGYYSGHREGLLEASLLQPGQGVPSNLDETWLETLVDVGIVGCAFLVTFALAGMARLIRYRKHLLPNVRWCALVLGILVFPITSFVNPTIQANISPNFVIWGFLLLVFPLGHGPPTPSRLYPTSDSTHLQSPQYPK